MAALLAKLPEPESEPMDTEEIWSKVMAQRRVSSRLARVREWTWPRRRWAVGLAAAACLIVLSFHYGVSVQVGQLKVAFGRTERSAPAMEEIVALNQELVRHLARYDEVATRVERTLLGLAHAISDLDTRHRQELTGLRNEFAAQRALDQSAIRKSFRFVASEMTDALRRQQ